MIEKSAMEVMDERIPVQPRVILGSFTLKARDIPLMVRKRELGPYDFDGEAVFLEINGTVVARGSIRVGDEGAEFVISEIHQEDR
jgi:hypothetical protein